MRHDENYYNPRKNAEKHCYEKVSNRYLIAYSEEIEQV